MTKIEDPDPGSGSGSISKWHGSQDPDPHQNIMDPDHWESTLGIWHYPHRGVHAGQDYRVQEYRLFSLPPSFKCNVLRESLSVDSQNHKIINRKNGQ
jgi:hypothetical protein